MFGVGVPELILIVIVILLLFGGKNLPELSKSIGQSIKELRKGFLDNPHDPKESGSKKS